MVVLLVVLFLLLLPYVLVRTSRTTVPLTCAVNPTDVERGPGFIIARDLLSDACRRTLIDTYLETMRRDKRLNEDRDLSFYTDRTFLDALSKVVGTTLYPVHRFDSQRCWLRYYFPEMKAQYYENFHHDIKRYRRDVKQYRLVVPIHDTSDTKFTIDGHGTFAFEENMGVFLEADNCLHKVVFTEGERLLLIMDFISEPCTAPLDHVACRGPVGYANWVKDTFWREVSSLYYTFVNR